MRSVLLVIENPTSDQLQFGFLLSGIKEALKQHTDIVWISTNVLLIPDTLTLLAVSEVDAQCRAHTAGDGKIFPYKCLFFEEELKWVYSTGRS